MTKTEAKKVVEAIPIDEFKKMMKKGGFLASIEFSEIRTIGKKLSTMEKEGREYVASAMRTIANITEVSDEDALRLAYALTEREVHLGYGTP